MTTPLTGLAVGFSGAAFATVVSVQTLSGDSTVGIPVLVSFGALVAFSWLIFRAGGAYREAMRDVEEAAGFEETLKEIADAQKSLQRRLDIELGAAVKELAKLRRRIEDLETREDR